MTKNNKMLDIISCIDDGQERSETLEELSNPSFLIGSKFTINKLINNMISEGLLYEESDTVFVTNKGKDFYENTDFEESAV